MSRCEGEVALVQAARPPGGPLPAAAVRPGPVQRQPRHGPALLRQEPQPGVLLLHPEPPLVSHRASF